MEIVLGILILLALCGSHAAKKGLTVIIGVPLGLVAAIMLVGMCMGIVNAGLALLPATPVAPYVHRSTLPPEQDDARNAESRILELRQRHGAKALTWTP